MAKKAKQKKKSQARGKDRGSTSQLFNFAEDSYLERTSRPIYATDQNVRYLNSESGGFFVPDISVGFKVEQGQRIGRILDALSGEVKEDVASRWNGYLFTIRAHPIVYPGSLMARVIEIA